VLEVVEVAAVQAGASGYLVTAQPQLLASMAGSSAEISRLLLAVSRSQRNLLSTLALAAGRLEQVITGASVSQAASDAVPAASSNRSSNAIPLSIARRTGQVAATFSSRASCSAASGRSIRTRISQRRGVEVWS